MSARPNPGPWLALAALVVVVDQGSKWLIQHAIPLGGTIPLTPWFNLVHIENPGAAFSFLAGQAGWQRWLFTALGLAASALIAGLLATRRRRPLFALGLALILGGALGNVLDRVLWGHVTDFLDVYVTLGGQPWHWPAFNLADAAISLGAASLLVDEWRQSGGPTLR